MPCLDNFCEQRLVGLASNFIVGDEVIPLDAEKHMETPLMGGIGILGTFWNQLTQVHLLKWRERFMHHKKLLIN